MLAHANLHSPPFYLPFSLQLRYCRRSYLDPAIVEFAVFVPPPHRLLSSQGRLENVRNKKWCRSESRLCSRAVIESTVRLCSFVATRRIVVLVDLSVSRRATKVGKP